MIDILSESSPFLPILCFLAGILTSFSPCSLSTMPLVIGFVSGGNVTQTKKAFHLSTILALGMAISFTSMGATAAIMGRFLGAANRYFYFLSGILMLLMAFQTWEIYTFIPPTYLAGKNNRKGYSGAFITGIFCGLFSTSCATPVLIFLLSLVAKSENPLIGIFYLFLFALGHGVLVIVGGTSTSLVKKIITSSSYGLLSNTLRIIMGTLIFFTGLYMLYLFF